MLSYPSFKPSPSPAPIAKVTTSNATVTPPTAENATNALSATTQEFTSNISLLDPKDAPNGLGSLENPSNALPTSINTISVSSLGVPSSVGIPDSGISTLTPPSSGALPSSIGSVSVSSLGVPNGGLPGTVTVPVKPGGSSVGGAAGDVSTLGVYDSNNNCVAANNAPGDPGYCKTTKELSDEADKREAEAALAVGEAKARAQLEAARLRAIIEARKAIGNDRATDQLIGRLERSNLYDSFKDNPRAKLLMWTGLGEAFKSGEYRNEGLSPKAYLEKLVVGAEHLRFAGRDENGRPIFVEAEPLKPPSANTQNIKMGGNTTGGNGKGELVVLVIAGVAIVLNQMLANPNSGDGYSWAARQIGKLFNSGDASLSQNKDDKAPAATSAEKGVQAASGSPDPNDPCGSQSFKELNGNRRADQQAQKAQFQDAHDFKSQYVGLNGSLFNMAIDKLTGRIWLVPVQNGPNIPTEYNKSGNYIGERNVEKGDC